MSAPAATACDGAGAPTRIRVWDRLVRLLHWLLAATVLTAWISGHWPPHQGFDAVHHTAGYVALAVVLLRLIWGGVGRGHARFGSFVRGPRATLAYGRQVLAGREARHIGHNPLGAAMVVALLATVAGAGLTGWLYTTEWLWGYEWLSDLHTALAWLLTGLVPAHLAGVALASWRHRENLVAAMFSGRKRAAEPGDVA